MRRLLVVSLALACVACGKIADGDGAAADASTSDTTSGDSFTSVGDASPELLEKCRRAAVARCHADHVCDAPGFEATKGDEATCIAGQLHVCGLLARGVTLDAYRAALDCEITLAATPDWLCAGWARDSHGWGPSCAIPPGPFSEGASCSTPLQCAGLVCEWGDASSPCGRCVTLTTVPLGGACTRDPQCGRTAWCSDARGARACAPVPAVGDPCPPGEACPNGTSCRRGICSPWQPLGASCLDAECTLGLDCGVGSICTSPALSKEGESCRVGFCVHGTHCRDDDAGRPTCTRYADFGEACVMADDCGGPWTCVDGRCAASVAKCP